MNIEAYVAGIGVLGPGLGSWTDTREVLAGRRAYAPAPTILPAPSILPATERRRTGRVVKVAIGVAIEAAAQAGVAAAELRSVFSSSGADGHNCHEICQALAQSAREISPTRFSNSVHNAAAGYWSIATGATQSSTVLCAFDGSFCAGLLEALTQVTVDQVRILLVAYDTEYPEPIRAIRPVPDAFGTAMVLTPRREPKSLARLRVHLVDEAPDTLAHPELEALRRSIPAARALPLLEPLAERTRTRTILEYLDVMSMAVEVEPCN
jgi:beta-ketoacyl synthase-like protein